MTKQKYSMRIERITDKVEHLYVEVIAEDSYQAEDRALDAAAERTDWIDSEKCARAGMTVRSMFRANL
jgi:hypothetical protein